MQAFVWTRLLVFFAMFGISFYALSAVKFETFCKTAVPMKIYVLLFLLSLILGYLSSEALLALTLFSGL